MVIYGHIWLYGHIIIYGDIACGWWAVSNTPFVSNRKLQSNRISHHLPLLPVL